MTETNLFERNKNENDDQYKYYSSIHESFRRNNNQS